MFVSDLDLRNYAGPIRVTAQHAQHVARAMEAAIPPDASAEERAAMQEALRAADAVHATLTLREQTAPGKVRPAFLAFGAAWSGLDGMLTGLARVPSELSARAVRAGQVLADALPEGIPFIQYDAAAAWAAGQRRIDHIDVSGLAPQIADLVGPDVLEAARRATAALREAAGAGPTPREASTSTAVADAVANFSRVLGAYCRILSAKVDETKESSVERFKKAVLPLDQYRATRRAQDDDAAEDPILPAVGNPAIPPGLPGAPAFVTPTT